jgi:endonuclease/exonuclease/phosphatase family metal-dependent hydrolase
MAVRFSRGGGRFGQHLALAWDQDVLQLVGEPVEIADMAVEPGMRPGFAAVFRSSADPALDFTAVTLHLESGRQAFGDRRRQNRALVDWIRGWLAAGGDPDLVVLGDFNSAGSPRGGAPGELQSMVAILGRAGLVRLENITGCTQYWEGAGDRDGVQVPSQLDHIFLTGPLAALAVGPAQSWLHCARVQCGDLVSRPGAEDGTFYDVSDHCPVTIELSTAG